MALHGNRRQKERRIGGVGSFNQAPGFAPSQGLNLGSNTRDFKKRTRMFTGGLVDRQFGFGQQAADAFGEGIGFLSLPNVLSGINRFGSEAQRQGAFTARGLGGRLSQSTGNPFLEDSIRIEQANLATGARNEFAGEQLSASAFARRKAWEAQLRLLQASAFGPETITSLPILNQELGFGQPNGPGKPTVAESIFGGISNFFTGGFGR